MLHGDHVAPWAEVALYAASRAQHVGTGDPTGARARGNSRLRPLPRHVRRLPGRRARLGVDFVLDLNLRVVEGLLPGATVLVEIDPETALARVGEKRDRIERADAAFWPLVVEAYRDLGGAVPRRSSSPRRPAARRGARPRSP